MDFTKEIENLKHLKYFKHSIHLFLINYLKYYKTFVNMFFLNIK